MAANEKFQDFTDQSKASKGNKSENVNSFANDGSFLEIYKQRLKELENAPDEKKDASKDEREERKTANLLLQV